MLNELIGSENYYFYQEIKTFRELKLLRSLIHDNVLEMVDAFTPDPNVQSLNNV